MDDVDINDTREARRLLAAAFETVPGDPAKDGDGLLRAVSRRHARRRRTRAIVSAGAGVAAAGTAVAVLLSATIAGSPPALAAVTSALVRASAESFRMQLTVTQHNTVPGQYTIKSPLRITGELDLKRHLGVERLSNGWRTLIVGREAYTELPPAQAERAGTGGKRWTQEPISDTQPPVTSRGARLAWDFNSDRPFKPPALLALLRSGAKVLATGSASGPGWTGTRYSFTLSHPRGTLGVVNKITCTVAVDEQSHIRSLVQTTAFAAGGKPGAATGTIYTLRFTFSDFGVRFSVTPPPSSQIDHDLGVAVQF